MEPQKALQSNSHPEKEEQSWTITLLIIKQYYRTIVIKTAQYWHKNRHIDQQNRIESPEINTRFYSPLIFDRRNKHIQWAKVVYSINDVGKIGQICAEHLLTPHTRINSKWIKDLNVTLKTIKILEEKNRKQQNLGHCSQLFLLDISSQA